MTVGVSFIFFLGGGEGKEKWEEGESMYIEGVEEEKGDMCWSRTYQRRRAHLAWHP